MSIAQCVSFEMLKKVLYITYESFKLQTLKRVKKLKKCYKRRKFSNSITPIPFEYWPKYFI